ncbi:ankyrin repeat domain-containing protein 12-like [Maniola hyperantus]|uniref:ankyrin repeat domain-containing protein 12-like n=1 Tax=Aphantopus hyperantus TaxID=2795564 RepID=UPI003748B393
MRSANTEAEPPCIDLTVCDLTDDIREPYQEQNLTEKAIQKELDIFREIERQHEIEEACEQIRREHFEEMNTGSKFVQIESKQLELTDSKIIMEDYNTETPEIVPDNILKRCDSKQFFETEESKGEIVNNENIESGNDATDGILLCLRNNMEHNNNIDFKYMEDFKEIDINLQENEKVTAENNFINIGMNIQEDQKSYEGEICKDKKIPEINETVQNESHISENANLDNKISGDEKEEIRTDNDKDSNQEKHENVTKNDRDEYIKNKRLRQQTREKYVDFLSDNEDFVWSSSSWEHSSSGSVSDGTKKTKKSKKSKKKNERSKKTTKSKVQEEENEVSEVEGREKKKQKNKRKENKANKDSGHEYVNSKGKVIPAKEMKQNPCNPQNCSNACYEITDEKRKAIFLHFWGLSSERRKDWLVSHSKKMGVKRKRADTAKRTNTFNYFINDGEGQAQVCQQFLTCTLDLKQKTLYNTVNNASFGSAKEDMRGKHEPRNKTPNLVTEKVRTYIKELPALPSHYCRKNSTRTYLPTEFRNISNLYRIYKETQLANGNAYAGEKLFKKIFNTEFNIGFHFPRKDKCLKCTQYENNKSFDAEEKRKHLIDKEESAERFKAHQSIYNKDNSVLCASFDLQKVLNTPHGENMMLYYSRKVAVYNLTFYESGTRNGFCYTWSENNGKRGANEISSILEKYINNVDLRGTVKHLLLYCDSCPGQNKNKIVLTCLNEILKKCNTLLSIQINYLLPGHTYMPVDSMHSVIDKSLRGIIVWAPSQWSTIFTMSRKSPRPYEVEVLNYADFNKWDTVAEKYFKGNLTGKISNLRTVTFKKSVANMAFVKCSMNPDAQTEEIEIVKKNNLQLKSCYKAMLPICKKKYTDLNKLCSNNVIPTVYHTEYRSMNNDPKVQNCLAETDEEDEVLA